MKHHATFDVERTRKQAFISAFLKWQKFKIELFLEMIFGQ